MKNFFAKFSKLLPRRGWIILVNVLLASALTAASAYFIYLFAAEGGTVNMNSMIGFLCFLLFYAFLIFLIPVLVKAQKRRSAAKKARPPAAPAV